MIESSYFCIDEEIGGDNGMKLFVLTEEFQRLNVGFALDEGISTPDDAFPVFYGERSVWRIEFVCKGTTGHGSLLPSNTAGEKLRRIIDRLLDFRAEQVERLKNNPEYTIGDVTSVNLTIVKGGVQVNVLPEQLSASFDIRLAIDVDHDEFEETVGFFSIFVVLHLFPVLFHSCLTVKYKITQIVHISTSSLFICLTIFTVLPLE